MANTIVKATPPTKTDHATSLLFTSADKGVITHIVFSLHKAKINILFVITDIMPDFILSPSSGS